MRVGVIGMGNMGKNHARLWAGIIGVELAAVCDINPNWAARLPAQAVAYRDYEEMLATEHLDAVSVCVPTHFHAAATIAALEAGCHVLVEKPISASAAVALEMMRCADENDRLLMVGQIERFNPAVKALIANWDRLGTVNHMAATRVGPMPSNPAPEGLFIDVGVHDIDVMCQLAGTPNTIYAQSSGMLIPRLWDDMVSATIRFDSGIVGTIHLAWGYPVKQRRLTVWGSAGRFELDYLKQDLRFFREGVETVVPVNEIEPLRAELEIFAEAVVDGWDYSPIPGREGRRALVYAVAMGDSAYERDVIDSDELYERLLEPETAANGLKPSETVENSPERL